MSAREPIMVRADLTPDEWKRLRKVAIDRDTTPREVATELLRDYVNLHDPPKVSK